MFWKSDVTSCRIERWIFGKTVFSVYWRRLLYLLVLFKERIVLFHEHKEVGQNLGKFCRILYYLNQDLIESFTLRYSYHYLSNREIRWSFVWKTDNDLFVTVRESTKSRSRRNALRVKHVSPPYQTLDCTSGWNCSTKVRKYIRVSCFDITQLFPMITFSSIHWKPWFALTWIFREVWNLVLTFLDRNNLRIYIYYPLYCTAKLSKRCSTRDKSKYTLNLKLEKVAPPIVQNSAISTPLHPLPKKVVARLKVYFDGNV